MGKRQIFWGLLMGVISIIAFVIIVKLIFKSDNVNEGKFRIADALLASSAELTDKTTQNGKWSLNISQKNVLALLINVGKDAKIDKIYATDVKIDENKNILFYILNSETRLELNRKKQEMDIEYVIDDNGQIKLEFIALNENILKNWQVPDSVKEIICDGRIFKTAGISLEDLQFTLSFDLNILEKNGKNNVVKVNLELPSEELVINGADVRKLSKSDFKFKVK